MSLRPIHRIKHVYDEQNALVAGTASTSNVVTTVDAPILANVAEVETGATVNSLFITVECVATSSAALSNVYFIIYKDPGNNIGAIPPNTVGSSDNKRFVFHQEMVMLQEQTGSNPRTVFKGVISIPKGYRRCAPDDRIKIRLLAPGVNLNYCMQVHYKEFR